MDRRQVDHGRAAAPHGASPAAPALAPLVGRADEMRRMEAALARAAKGRGGALFLLGEAGIGKTRLAQEVVTLARARGFPVLEGRAYSMETGLAYASILRALGPFLRAQNPVRQSSLFKGLPDLGRLFSSLPLAPPEPLGNAALEKTRLFEAVSRLLDRLARDSPVVLSLDDLHWADPASLELLHYVAHGLAEQRVLVVATCNSAQMGAARRLRLLLRSLERVGLAEELVLPRLDSRAVAAMADQLLEGEAPPDLLALLDARAAGTPLFVEALIRALVDAGQLVRGDGGWALGGDAANVLPTSVRESVLERLERLEATDRRLLDLIAVSDDAASHPVLRAATGLAEDVLLTELRHLHEVGLAIERTDGREVVYGVTHPLVQEVAYAELSEMARRRLHATLAEVLERLSPDDPLSGSAQTLGRLARHYRGAGSEADQGRALAVLIGAGERAREIYANDEAARHFGAALALLRAGYGTRLETEHAKHLLPHVLERLGEAWERVGETGAAVGVWTEALAEYERVGEVYAAARLHRLVAPTEWDRGHFDAAQQHLSTALAGLAGQEPSQELAEIHLARAMMLWRLGDTVGVMAESAELRVLAARLMSPRSEAEADLAEAMVYWTNGDTPAARERALSALSTAEKADDPLLGQRAHDRLTLIAFSTWEHRLERYHAERSLELAKRMGAPTLELLPCRALVFAHIHAGAWEDGLRRGTEALALARRLGHGRHLAHLLPQRAWLLSLRGDQAAAEACVVEARAVFGDHPADRHVSAFMDLVETILALERGEAAQAYTVARSFARSTVPGSAPDVPDALLPQSLALLAEAQVGVGQPESALATARQLAALDSPLARGSAPAVGKLKYPGAAARWVEGLARQALGDAEVALSCLAQAADAFAGLDIPFDGARARLEWAALAARSGGNLRQPAVAAAEESLTIFERLGARRYAQRARHLLHQLGVRPPARRRGRPTVGPLSIRELEVARLVVDGFTAPEVAERLSISQHTARTHLRRIYSRLGITSRAALARYVVESGLLGPQA